MKKRRQGFISQGDVMPALSGAPALWRLSVTGGA
jgi:hypothetical protein